MSVIQLRRRGRQIMAVLPVESREATTLALPMVSLLDLLPKHREIPMFYEVLEYPEACPRVASI